MNYDDLSNHFDEFLSLFAENTRGHVINKEIEDQYILSKAKELLVYLNEKKAILLGLYSLDKLIGFLWAYPRVFFEEERLYINSLIVRDGYRGKSFGQQLLKELENIALEKKIAAIDVTTASFKTDTINFYEKNGFRHERVQLRKSIFSDLIDL